MKRLAEDRHNMPGSPIGWPFGSQAIATFYRRGCLVTPDWIWPVTRNRRSLIHLSLLALLALLPAESARGEDATARYFRGLRERKLFSLAEGYCLHRLSQPKLTPVEAARLTIELSSTLSDHAAEAREDEQTELWTRARTTISTYLRNNPASPLRLPLEVQGAQVLAAQGETLRWQAELLPHQREYRDRAREVLESAIAALRALEPRVAAAGRRAVVDPRGDHPKSTPPRTTVGLEPLEQANLLLNVRFRLAMSLLNLAHVLPAQDATRAACLIDAEKLLRGLGGDAADPQWNMRVLAAQCARLQGDLTRGRREIEALDALQPPPEVQSQLLAERIRLLLAEQKATDARRLLLQSESGSRPLSPELSFLRVQVLSELWQQVTLTGDMSSAAKLLAELRQTLTQLTAAHAGYWSLRAELIERQILDLEAYGPALAPLVREAESDYAEGRMNAAIDKFGRAATQAHRGERRDLAFRLGFTRASIQQQAGLWSDSSAGFQELAKQFPDHPQAADAHLLAAFGLGKMYAEKQTRTRRLVYTTALEDHRRLFPSSPTAVDAIWMLAQLEDRREQFGQAVSLYQQISADHPRGMAARLAEATCYSKILDRLEPGPPRDAWEQAALARLQQIVHDLPEPAPGDSGWSGDRAALAIEFANRLLEKQSPDFAAADRWLARVSMAKPMATVATPPTPEGAARMEREQDLQARAARLRIVSLAGQGRPQEAREWLDSLSATDPPELLRILEGIEPLAASAPAHVARDLGELQLTAAERLQTQRQGLSAADQRRLDVCRARALVATGQPRKALEVYNVLLNASPQDKSLLAAAARLQSDCGTKDCLPRALELWKKLESLEKPGSPAWLQFRFEVCQTLLLQGELAECRKLLKVTQLLYPEAGTPDLRKKLADLAQRANGQRSR